MAGKLLRLALLCGGLLVGIAVAELALRIVRPEFSPLRSGELRLFFDYDPRLGWSHRPGTRGRLVGEFFDVGLRINSQGLRGPEVRNERPDDRRRVLVVGDSFAWGWGVEEDDSIAARLATLLDQDVVNGATAGYSTDQELLWYLDRGARFDVDRVLLLVCFNDLVGNASTTFHGYPKPIWRPTPSGLELANVPVPELGVYARLSRWLKRRTYLGNAVAAAKRSLASRGAEQAPGRPGLVPAQWSITSALLEKFTKEVRDRGAEFAWVLVPKVGMSVEARTALSQLAERLGVPMLDLTAAFAAGSVSGVQLTFESDPHWNREGHALAATEVADFLRALDERF